MSRYIPYEERPDCEILKEIEQEYQQWNHIATHGCQDPFWPDGVNMNLTRNHIIFFYRMLDERQRGQQQLSMFDMSPAFERRPIPPKAPDNLMIAGGDHAHRLDGREQNLVWIEPSFDRPK